MRPLPWLTAATLAGIAVAHFAGFLPIQVAIDGAMGTVALAGLLAVTRMPWDLYFEAKALATDQATSLARGIEVSGSGRESARVSARRLLALSVGLHLGGAAIACVVTAIGKGTVGYAFAAFYVLAMGVRPLTAFYRHELERLRALRSATRYPIDDVRRVEGDLAQQREAIATLAETMERRHRELEERMATRVSRDETLLTAIRAFLTAVRAEA